MHRANGSTSSAKSSNGSFGFHCTALDSPREQMALRAWHQKSWIHFLACSVLTPQGIQVGMYNCGKGQRYTSFLSCCCRRFLRSKRSGMSLLLRKRCCENQKQCTTDVRRSNYFIKGPNRNKTIEKIVVFIENEWITVIIWYHNIARPAKNRNVRLAENSSVVADARFLIPHALPTNSEIETGMIISYQWEKAPFHRDDLHLGPT